MSPKKTFPRKTLKIFLFSSVFTMYPDVQRSFFPLMDGNDVVRLGNHGCKVIMSVGKLVQFVEEGRTDELVKEIGEVNN